MCLLAFHLPLAGGIAGETTEREHTIHTTDQENGDPTALFI